MEKVPVLVIRALKVNMKRLVVDEVDLVVDEVDQEARTVGGVDDGGEGTWCQLGQKSFIIFPSLSCGKGLTKSTHILYRGGGVNKS